MGDLDVGGAGLDMVAGPQPQPLLISASSPHGNVLKIRPPLPFTEANANYFLEIFSDVMAEARKTGAAL